MIVIRLDADGKVALPQEVLDALELTPGDKVGFAVENGEVILFRAAPDDEVDEETGLKVGELRALIEEGQKGPYISMEEAVARLRAHAAAARSAAE